MWKRTALASQKALRGIFVNTNIQENYGEFIFHKKIQYYGLVISRIIWRYQKIFLRKA